MANQRRKSRPRKRTDQTKQEGLLFGVALLVIFVSASLYFQSQTGFLGKTLGQFLFQCFGWTAYLLPPMMALFAVTQMAHQWKSKFGKSVAYLFALAFFLLLLSWLRVDPRGSFQTSLEMAGEWGVEKVGPGLVGGFFGFLIRKIIGSVGIYLAFVVVLGFFILHLTDHQLKDLMMGLRSRLTTLFEKRASEKEVKKARGARTALEEGEEKEGLLPAEAEASVSEEFLGEPVETPLVDQLEKTPIQIKDYVDLPVKARIESEDSPKQQASRVETAAVSPGPPPCEGYPTKAETAPYHLPPIRLLQLPKRGPELDPQILQNNAVVIERTLRSFGIESEVVSIQRGPTVALYELKPAPGVKVSRITNLANDLALSLAASDIRIEAPIPGKPYVGIEVPNPQADMVALREIIQSQAFEKAHESMPIALGQSIDGRAMIAKIAKMPHLLIAGATGSGKSVCINTIILSLLYKYAPSDVRMILIDPKVVELSVYNGIPHLLIPVVTDPKKASKALYTAVQEMERRFRLFSQYAVRDIQGYREKCKVEEDMEVLPYLVVIVDELSDLMMVASKDVEAHITRLAQMARACGIHLIIATQRPSVDVITGTIKANIPSRISFQVSSSIDSRTILDQSGAETLLGKGDMLYYPSHLPKPVRVQGAFVSDGEVARVVDYIKEKHEAAYDKAFIESLETPQGGHDAEAEGDENQDELMGEVLEFISHEETTSISGLQRRFRIGYARAGRLIDDLEAMGAVSAQDGSKAREVLIRPEGERKGSSDEFAQ